MSIICNVASAVTSAALKAVTRACELWLHRRMEVRVRGLAGGAAAAAAPADDAILRPSVDGEEGEDVEEQPGATTHRTCAAGALFVSPIFFVSPVSEGPSWHFVASVSSVKVEAKAEVPSS